MDGRTSDGLKGRIVQDGSASNNTATNLETNSFLMIFVWFLRDVLQRMYWKDVWVVSSTESSVVA